MSLDATKPTDEITVAELPAYIRACAAAINAISGSGNVGITNLSVTAGMTSLTVGTNVGSYGLEVVIVTGAGVAVLTTILGGTDGQIKIFIFQDANVSITDGAKSVGKFYLNHLPALSNFAPQQDDVLAIVNVGGDGAAVYGYWKELFRTISVK